MCVIIDKVVDVAVDYLELRYYSLVQKSKTVRLYLWKLYPYNFIQNTPITVPLNYNILFHLQHSSSIYSLKFHLLDTRPSTFRCNQPLVQYTSHPQFEKGPNLNFLLFQVRQQSRFIYRGFLWVTFYSSLNFWISVPFSLHQQAWREAKGVS